MRTIPYVLFFLVLAVGFVMLPGCTYGTMRAGNAGLVIYTEGARQHTATVQLDRTPAEVYAGMQRVIARNPKLQVVNDDSKRYLLEVVDGERRLTGQAMLLDEHATLLFIWADAGESGQTGRDLALKAAQEICAELQVTCKVESL